MTKATLVLLRHGQTEDNIRHLMTGQNDVPLTKAGEEQAHAAGTLIGDVSFDKVYSSPLSRAFNTAALALKAAGQDMAIERRREILEGDNGELTGLCTKNPVVIGYFRHAAYGVAPPGGESNKQLVARVRKFYDEELLPGLARGENILVAAHRGTIQAFDIAMGLSPAPADGEPWENRRSSPNAGPVVHEYEDGVLKKSYDIENPETVKADNRNKPPKEADRFKP